ncbi:MAG: lysine-2,3-aminomutase-like protein [Gammaproteobacteria bacterium]|nr:lysine-2,3-aminomutase-like protein [Gammaproteobacteria bacterium]
MSSDKTLRSVDSLIAAGFIKPQQRKVIEQVSAQFSTAITPQMATLIEHQQRDPLGQQFVPSAAELSYQPQERADPIGDEVCTAVKGVIHRYPDRCLLQPLQVCAVYCRFCFRREQLASNNSALTAEELEMAYQYITDHRQIWEVILTGGDPLMMKPKSLQQILQRLDEISSVEVVRLHSRIPVVDSVRINEQMVAALQLNNKPVYVILHANHPKEFTAEATQAIARLVDNGIPMLSQTVLLKGINDDIDTLSTLMRQFVRHRIKPYYLHHGDLARGTGHFRTTIESGQQLMKQLRGRFSGLCQPTYVLDIPGGHGKVPLTADYIQSTSTDSYQVEDYCGGIHHYV